MSRGRKRNLRSHQTKRITTSSGESQRSKSYTAGKAVQYKYRIRGPQFPVVSLTDLPEGSKLG